jgi:hypothetical protein
MVLRSWLVNFSRRFLLPEGCYYGSHILDNVLFWLFFYFVLFWLLCFRGHCAYLSEISIVAVTRSFTLPRALVIFSAYYKSASFNTLILFNVSSSLLFSLRKALSRVTIRFVNLCTA